MNPIHYPRPGFGHANAFMTAGIPYVTGTTLTSASFSTLNGQVRFSFPRVARAVTVINKSNNDIRVHFNSLADGRVEQGHHYITLDDVDDSITFQVKCKQIFISLASASNAPVEVYADITNVPTIEMFELSGSGLTE